MATGATTLVALASNITNELGVLDRSLATLGYINSKSRNAGGSINSVMSQLPTLRLSLSQLLQWMQFASADVQGESILLDNLEISINGSESLLNLLNAEIQNLANGNSHDRSLLKKTQLLLIDRVLQERQKQLDFHILFLSYLLHAIGCQTAAERERFLTNAKVKQIAQAIEADNLSTSRYRNPGEHLTGQTSSKDLLQDPAHEATTDSHYSATETSNQSLLRPAQGPQKEESVKTDRDKHNEKVALVAKQTKHDQALLQIPKTEPDSNRSLSRFKRLKSFSHLSDAKLTRKASKPSIMPATETPDVRKVLLLGASGSGKTTLLRSFMGLGGASPAPIDRLMFPSCLTDTLCERLFAVVNGMRQLEIEPQTEAAQEALRMIKSEGLNTDNHSKLCSAAQAFAEDPAIEGACRSSRRCHVPKDTHFLLKNATRLIIEQEISEEDCFRVWNRSTGICHHKITSEDKQYAIYDYAGCRSERKKWHESFTGTRAVIFVVDVTCWNDALFEAHDSESMAESLALFDAIINSKWFTDVPVILVFTNRRSLKQKLQADPLQHYFPDFEGGDDEHVALFRIKKAFKERIRRSRITVTAIATDVEDELRDPAEKILNVLDEVIVEKSGSDASSTNVVEKPLSPKGRPGSLSALLQSMNNR
ncbi:MAG: hypothetical protein Q9159_003010 [Coniocarpon cinnabarinum]